MSHVLVCRLDSDGDVLVTGPAIRAVAAGATRVTLLCGPRGRAAAELLPGVDAIVEYRAPWIDPEPAPVRDEDVRALAGRLAALSLDEAVIFTSFHQSALPTALVLRLAGIPRVAAISEDYPGSLLDLRHRDPGDVHEVERALSLAEAAGYPLPDDDSRRLEVRRPAVRRANPAGDGPYVVLHPGASVPARTASPGRWRELAATLGAAGRRVVVTGGPAERELTALVAGHDARDLGGATDLATLAEVIAGADAVVVGNTAPAHLAAAAGTPVVSLFAPVVPARRWRPWGVPHVLLGDQEAPCRDSRARVCPVAGHPCLDGISTGEVLAAVDQLAPAPTAREPSPRAVEVGR